MRAVQKTIGFSVSSSLGVPRAWPLAVFGFRVWGLGFRVWGLGLGV